MKRTRRILSFLFWAILLALLGGGVYVSRVGFPNPVVKKALAGIEERLGVDITAERVRWTSWRGVAANSVRVTPKSGANRLQFGSAEIATLPPGTTNESSRIRMELANGLLEAPATTNRPSITIAIDRADIQLSPGQYARIQIDGSTGDDWHFRVGGTILLGGKPAGGEARELDAHDLLEQIVQPLAALVKLRERGLLPESLQSELRFEFDTGKPAARGAWLVMRGGPMTIGKLEVSESVGVARLDGDKLHVESLQLSAASPRADLRANAELSIKNRNMTGAVRATLSTAALASAHPAFSNQWSTAFSEPMEVAATFAGNLDRPGDPVVDFMIERSPSTPRVSDSPLGPAYAQGSFSNRVLRIAHLRARLNRPLELLQPALQTKTATFVNSTSNGLGKVLTEPLDLIARADVDMEQPLKSTVDFTIERSQSTPLSADSPLGAAYAHGSFSNRLLHIRRVKADLLDPQALLPPALQAKLKDASVNIGELGTIDMTLGPSPLTNLLSHVEGRISRTSLSYRKVPLDDLAFDFMWDDKQFDVKNARAAISLEGEAHYVHASGFVHRSGALRFELHSDAPPQLIASVLPSNTASVVRSFYTDPQCNTEVTIDRSQAADELEVKGNVNASGVSRNGVSMDVLSAAFGFRDGKLSVRDLALVRPDGNLLGGMEFDTASKRLSFEGFSSIPPPELARFIYPDLERRFSPYRFKGGTAIEGGGYVVLKPDTREQDFRLKVDASGIGWGWAVAEQARFGIAVTPQGVQINDIRAEWCGGVATGRVAIVKSPTNDAPARCDVSLEVGGIDLARLAEVVFRSEDPEAYRGILSGTVNLSGYADTNFLATATGNGGMDIDDGYILSVPVFGGLSRYLSAMLPGLGYASQRDFHCTFEVRDGGMRTSDARLLGRLLSIKGNGTYRFDKQLDFRLQVLFLKEGLTATVTRILTSPLTKALEFELSGTTDDPQWQMRNAPSRLLNFLGDVLGGGSSSEDSETD